MRTAAPFYQMTVPQYGLYVRTLVWYEDEEEYLADPATATPVDLTGWRVRMQVREDYDAAAALLDLDTDEPHVPGTSGLVLDPLIGAVTLYLLCGEAWDGAVYDVVWSDPDGIPQRNLQGTLTVDRGVTRA